MDEEIYIEEEAIPSFITDDYLSNALQKITEFIRELRSQGSYDVSNQIIRLVTITENLHNQLKNGESKFDDLNEKYVDASKRIEETMKISQKDHDTIQQLKDEVRNAWINADTSKVREQHTLESLNEMRERFFDLTQRMNNVSMKVIEDTDDELADHKSKVIQECERLIMENEELNKRLLLQRAYSDQLQKKLEESLEKNRDMFREWDLATNNILSNKKKVETLSKKIEEMTDEQEKLMESLVHYKEAAESRYKKLKQRDKQVSELSEKLQDIKNDNALINAVKSKLELSFKSYKSDIENYKHEINQLKNYLRLKDDENRKILNQYEHEVKKVENFARKLANVEKILSRHEQELITKKNEIVTLEKERDLMKKSSDDMKKENDGLQKKLEINLREMEKFNSIILNLKIQKESVEKDVKNVTSDLKFSVEREKKLSADVKKLHANIEIVESEKLYLNEALKQLNEEIERNKKQFDQMKDELHKANEQVAYFKHENSTALKHLKDARSDFQRCHEKESNVNDRMTKFKNQIDDANNRLTEKINQIGMLSKRIKAFEKKNREIMRDLGKTQDSLKICRNEKKNLAHENETLKQELHENMTHVLKMKIQIDKTLRERDMVANEMYRRVDTNSMLEDEIKTLKISNERGNALYNERAEDVNVLKNEVKNLRSQCNVLKRALENTTDMRHEVLQLHRKLNQERTKAKVLQEEMLTPMNVHRWRKLNQHDPTRMELLMKCQRLQRKSLKQFAQIKKSEEYIKELQDCIENLQKEIAKRPSVDLQEKLLLTRTKMHKNVKHMKAAIALSRATKSELTMKDRTINQLQKDLNELNSQLLMNERVEKLTEKNSPINDEYIKRSKSA